jgi:hypothetical protein
VKQAIVRQFTFTADEEILHHPHQGVVSHVGCLDSPLAGGTSLLDNRDDADVAPQRIALPVACEVS